MKKFFTVIPLQVAGQLQRYRYEPVGNSRLGMERETAFPILTAVHGYAGPEEPFTVVAVVVDNEVGKANLEIFQNELDALCQAEGLTCARVEQVLTSSDERVSTHAALFQKLIRFTQEGDELFACITFGTKPMSMAVRMAVQYAYRVNKNTTIDCIVYGQIDRPSAVPESWKGYVYDETALVRLDEIVRMMAEHGVTDPKNTIDMILNL